MQLPWRQDIESFKYQLVQREELYLAEEIRTEMILRRDWKQLPLCGKIPHTCETVAADGLHRPDLWRTGDGRNLDRPRHHGFESMGRSKPLRESSTGAAISDACWKGSCSDLKRRIYGSTPRKRIGRSSGRRATIFLDNRRNSSRIADQNAR